MDTVMGSRCVRHVILVLIHFCTYPALVCGQTLGVNIGLNATQLHPIKKDYVQTVLPGIELGYTVDATKGNRLSIESGLQLVTRGYQGKLARFGTNALSTKTGAVSINLPINMKIHSPSKKSSVIAGPLLSLPIGYFRFSEYSKIPNIPWKGLSETGVNLDWGLAFGMEFGMNKSKLRIMTQFVVINREDLYYTSWNILDNTGGIPIVGGLSVSLHRSFTR